MTMENKDIIWLEFAVNNVVLVIPFYLIKVMKEHENAMVLKFREFSHT